MRIRRFDRPSGWHSEDSRVRERRLTENKTWEKHDELRDQDHHRDDAHHREDERPDSNLGQRRSSNPNAGIIGMKTGTKMISAAKPSITNPISNNIRTMTARRPMRPRPRLVRKSTTIVPKPWNGTVRLTAIRLNL